MDFVSAGKINSFKSHLKTWLRSWINLWHIDNLQRISTS